MKSLQVPSTLRESHWQLNERDKFFLDLTIMFNMLPAELYRMVYISQETQVMASKKANAIMRSTDGKEYIELRTKQLIEWYGNDGESSNGKAKAKTMEEAFVDLSPTFISELYTIMQNRNDPSYADTVKLFLAKSLKDIQMDKSTDPPRRYLPESCANCRYKTFCEEQCEDVCEICKYKEYSNQNGVYYDYKSQLDTDDEVQ